jgi:putative glutamine amidotransferase
VLGVQWHPERSYEISAASRALFARLVEEARRVETTGVDVAHTTESAAQ